MFFPNKSKPHIVRAVAAPTTSYVSGTVFSIDEQNMVGLMVSYTKGDETSIELKVESSIDGGSTFYQQITQSPSGGTITIVPGIYSITAASYPSGTSNITFVISPIKGDVLRVSVKSTGGTPTGTVGITAITGWV